MRRREFITVLGGAAAWPLAARAQAQKRPVIGFLGTNTPSAQARWTAAFLERLAELGWTDGQSVAIEYRWAEGRTDQFAKMAAELVRLRVNVIVTSGTPATQAARRASSAIPIIFALSADPVGSGLVADLARPGGNATGLTNQSRDLIPRRIELLREAVPDLRRLAIVANAAFPDAVVEMRNTQSAARALGLDVKTAEIRRSEDIAPAFDALKADSQALYVCTDSLIFINRARINALASSLRLPTMYGFRPYVEAGGLMSYGAEVTDLFRRAAGFVDKVLRGAKPRDIPVEPPAKYELLINSTAAKALGLTLPAAMLARADEVIE